MEIQEYNEFEAKVSTLEDMCNFLPDCSNDDGYEKSKRVSLDTGKVLTAIEKKRKEIKAPALERCRFIDSEAKDLKERIEAVQLPHKEAYKAIDNEKKRKEEERLEKINDRFQRLYQMPELARLSSAQEIQAIINSLKGDEYLDCDEKTNFALLEKKRILVELNSILSEKVKAEEEQKELNRLRAEAAKREQKEREDRIAKEAEEKAKREAEAEKQAAIEAEKREQERLEREKQAAIQAKKNAEDRERQSKIDAERAAQEAARLATEESERKAKEAVEQERKAVEAQKAKEAAEAKAREENKKHRAKINNEAVSALLTTGISEEQAKVVVTAIAKKEIPNVSIQY
jgi:hypothetical protein